jgi:hypothetical protein
MSGKSVITVNTMHGNAEAIRDKPDEPWEINYPWGADRFYGTVPELIRHMDKEISGHPGEERSYLPKED